MAPNRSLPGGIRYLSRPSDGNDAVIFCACVIQILFGFHSDFIQAFIDVLLRHGSQTALCRTAVLRAAPLRCICRHNKNEEPTMSFANLKVGARLRAGFSMPGLLPASITHIGISRLNDLFAGAGES
jgi:hypothetical protein